MGNTPDPQVVVTLPDMEVAAMRRHAGAMGEAATGPQRGMTLVELMVTITLTSTVVAVVAGGLVTATQLMGSNSLRLQEVGENQVAIEAMTKTMRTAVEPRLLGAALDATGVHPGRRTGGRLLRGLVVTGRADRSGDDPLRPGAGHLQLTDGELVETYQLPDAHLPSNHDYTYCTAGSTGARSAPGSLPRTSWTPRSSPTTARAGTRWRSPCPRPNLEAVDSIDIVVTSQTAEGTESSTVVSRVSLVNSGTNPTASPTPSP